MSKYGCFKVSNVGDRCTQLAPSSTYTPKYDTKTDCMRNCNTEEEEEALRKLREKFRLKDLTEMIRPGLIASFDRIKDTPLLDYKGVPYTNKILNSEELYHLYITINRRNSFGSHKNDFLDDVKKKLNVKAGKDIVITFTEKRIMKVAGIEFTEDFDSDFLEDRKGFEKELNEFIASTSTFMIKNILINNFITEINHHTIMLIKKETVNRRTLLSFFIYDPTAGSYLAFYDLLEVFIKDACETIDVDCKVTQLSKIYGIQNIEVHKQNDEKIIRSINRRMNDSMKDIVFQNKDFIQIFLYKIVVLLANKYKSKSFVPLDINGKTFPTNFDNMFIGKKDFDYPINIRMWITNDDLLNKIFNDNDGWLKQNIDAQFVTIEELKSYEDEVIELGRKLYPSIDKDHIFEEELISFIKKIYSDLYTWKHDEYLYPIYNIFMKMSQKLMSNIIKLRIRLEDLDNQIYNYYKMDYFSGYCYMWSYYIIFLILMNQTIDPYMIIKATFFQTIDESRMKNILKHQIYDIQSILNSDDKPNNYFFNKNYIDDANKNIDEAKSELPTELTPDDNQLVRKLFIKITNFLLINVIYNKSNDKYLSYKYSKTGEGEYTENKFIAPKVDEILKDYTLDGVDFTLPKEDFQRAFIDRVLAGELLVEVNRKIEATKPTVSLVLENKYQSIYKQKYLKYKSKYLALKKS